ncbi:ABC transporter substrate-binding protein [Pseudorhodoferax sp.]|uniref:ABC transporter substrate-binding protein n=1 Tax=Pseudorhodoferax sp. TaxID=1993553 RepID=UPI002DD66C54|nr:ABC transporter substrate-binding protein [Pseudorhodoferax sp.]
MASPLPHRIAGCLLAGALALAAAPAQADDGITRDEILLGGSNAASGPVASVCYAVTHGQQAHFKRINAAGGIHGRKIRYEVLDDAYSAQRAIGNARRLMQQDKVFALFGGCGTVTAAGLLSATERSDIPYLFPYAGLDQLTKPTRPNVFALMPLYSEQTSAIVPYAVRKAQAKTAVMFSTNIAGHEGWRQAARDELAAAKVELLLDGVMEVTSPDRAAFAVQAKDKNPDLLLVMDTAPNAARLLIELQRQNWKPKAISGYSTLTDEVFLRAAAANAEGILVGAGVVLPPTAPQSKACVDELAAYDKSIAASHFSMYGCLSAMVLVEALQRAGPDLTRARLVATLEAMKDFETGISGKVSFAPGQHMGLREVLPFGIENGAYKVLGPALPTARR